MNDAVHELCQNEAHRGTLEAAAAGPGERIVQAEGRNPLCGDAVTFYLRIAPKRSDSAPVVAQAAWDGYACLLCRASAEAAARLIEGQPVAEGCEPPLSHVLHELGDIQPKRSRERCVRLPLDTCKEAVHEYFRSQDR